MTANLEANQTMSALPTPRAGHQEPAVSPVRAVLGSRNFRLLWLGEAISMLGDQFYMIALPWLVLRLTGDAVAVGAVLALAGVPRALFMLVGGAFTDRFSPRAIMLASNVSRLFLMALLALLVAAGLVQLWMLYILALLFGLADAFFYPAQGSIVPRLVPRQHLQAGNAIIQGTAQLSLFLGPVLAGVIIAMLGGAAATDGASDLSGLAVAFGIDAVTFLASAVTLWFVREPRSAAAVPEASAAVLQAIVGGLRFVWQDVTLRTFFFVVAAVATVINGVMGVGMPVLVDARLPEGAAAFGLIMSAFGAGSLLGMGIAGALPKPGRLGIALLVVTIGLGLALIGFAFATTTWLAALIGFGMGASNGYVTILFITWLQQRSPENMLGRMMSLLMFASVGMSPIATAITGVLLEWSLTAVFFGAGTLILLSVAAAFFTPVARDMTFETSSAA